MTSAMATLLLNINLLLKVLFHGIYIVAFNKIKLSIKIGKFYVC